MTALLAATFLLLQLLCQVLATVESDGALPPGYVEYPPDNTAYKLFKNQLSHEVTWNEARQRCISEGADLVVATTTHKIKHIQESGGHNVWIGIHRPTNTSDWIRIDNDLPVTSLPWENFTDGEDFNCAITRWTDEGTITNSHCAAMWEFTCEISLAEGGNIAEVEGGSKLPRGYVEYPWDNFHTAIKIHKDRMTWNEARERCVSEGADLAVATSPEKIRHIRSLLENEVIWIGIHRPTASIHGDWIRVDTGRPVQSLPWTSFSEDADVNCAAAYNNIGTITNWLCTREWPFACEISLDEGKPGPVGPAGAPGPMGPQGPPGLGFNATWFALLAACQEQSQVASLTDGSESLTDSGNYSLIRQTCEEFITEAYGQMRVAFQNPIEPEVQEESTAKTCRDLFVAHPDTPSGEYWIDPNGGDASDKIFVHCDAEERSTCISPAINQSEVITYEGEQREVWLSELETGMQINYTAASSQINALQSLSRHAKQQVTYHCLKSVGYFDAEGQTYERGLKLSAWTEVELTPRGRRRLRYEVISDECQNRSNDWQETVIAYRTSRPVLLPVLDVALRDLGGPDKKAIVEIGDVCFI